MNGIINLQLWQMIAAYIFVIILLFIVKIKGIPREREILISSIRMTIQLMITGYILVYIFKNPSPLFTLLVLMIMEVFAVYNIIKRTKSKLSTRLIQVISLSMFTGTVTCLLYFLFIVIHISPWYNPQYFIPIAGMLIGNSMTGVSLGIARLVDAWKHKGL
jgi:putative ABC transport system permease protein